MTVLIPAYMEEGHIAATLDSVRAQDYRAITEILVVDGGSSDRTRGIAADMGAIVLENPRRIQAAALNIGLAAARGDIIVRVDAHCQVETDYVSACVAALERTSAAMVGGAMRPVATHWLQAGVALAMASPLGVGPARFHVGGEPGWVDTVYLGAYRTEIARSVGGYSEDVGVNEDAEFAYRLVGHGGVWFDPTIRSTYVPRADLPALARQFWRYGVSRSATVRTHPGSLKPRQLVAPGLVLAIATPWRRFAIGPYAAVVAGVGFLTGRRSGWSVGAAMALCLPVMHLAWGSGFLAGAARLVEPPRGVPTGDAHVE